MANKQNFTDPNRRDWNTEERWWRDNFSSRPYARAGRDFDYYRGGYRYGFENAARHPNRSWDEVETELRSGWDKYEHRGRDINNQYARSKIPMCGFVIHKRWINVRFPKAPVRGCKPRYA